MVQLTPNFAFPYPQSTDNVNLWEHFENLAEALDTFLALPTTCKLVATATQSLPHNTRTAITFTGAEDDDAGGWHNPSVNPSRVTPNRAGRYLVAGSLYLGGRSDYTLIVADVAKNGVALAPAEREQPNTQSSARSVAPPTTTVRLNGTTDYVELYGQHTNGASAAQVTNQSSQFSCALNVVWIGP